MAKEKKWGSNLEFLLTLVGYSVGVSNVWRFPYLCMRNGGGAFLLPYLASLVLCAMPLFVLEVCAGQFSGFGAVRVWNICPLFEGIGIGTFILITVCAIYYNTLITWVLYYLFKSCGKVLPWSTCDNNWNSPSCWIRQSSDNLTTGNVSISTVTVNHSHTANASILWYSGHYTPSNMSGEPFHRQNETVVWKSPADEFWHNQALELSSGITNLGGLKWDLVGCFCLAWFLVFLCICKSTKSLGKVVYVTAPLPYVLLSILLVRGVLLPGSLEGIKYYIIPDWNKLLKLKVWTEAALQVFYSIGPAWGALFTMASYNKFNSDCIRGAVCTSLIGAGTSFFAGFVIFSVIGFMAFKSGLAIDDVIASGPSLSFIAYPEAISRMPLSPFWAILFFLMLVIIGINSEIFFVETSINCIKDLFPEAFKEKKLIHVACLVVLFFLIGVIMCTRGGMYIFLLVDWYVGPITPFINGLLETVIVYYIYGYEQFYADIKMMLGHKPFVWWRICWGYICPVMLLIMTVYNLAALGEPYYQDYTYPDWIIGIGWTIAISSFVPIPVMMVKCLYEQEGSLLERIKASLKPSNTWGPSDPKLHVNYKYLGRGNTTCSMDNIFGSQHGSVSVPQESTVLNEV